MRIIKTVVFIPDPKGLSQAIASEMLSQAQNSGTLDIPAVQRIVRDFTKLIHNTQIVPRSELERAVNVDAVLQHTHLDMEQDIKRAVMYELAITTHVEEEDMP
jgi:hypothetical protein